MNYAMTEIAMEQSIQEMILYWQLMTEKQQIIGGYMKYIMYSQVDSDDCRVIYPVIEESENFYIVSSSVCYNALSKDKYKEIEIKMTSV